MTAEVRGASPEQGSGTANATTTTATTSNPPSDVNPISALPQSMKNHSQEPLHFVSDSHGRSTPLAGVEVPKETECTNSSKDRQGLSHLQDVGPNLAFDKPLRTKAGRGSPRQTVKAKWIPLFLLVAYFFVPFQKLPLPWLAPSNQYLLSCLHQILHSTEMYFVIYFLNGSAPNISCTWLCKIQRLLSADQTAVAPFTFQPLPLGSIKPLGWIDDQMNLMASGLAGQQYNFYHIVQHSPWLGGHSEYSPLHEGLPYWFNGLVPLAYGLNDVMLIQQVEDVSDLVLNHQQSDGWLGPEAPAHRDLWGRFPFMLGLMQQVEAEPDRAAKIIPAMYRFVKLMHSMLLDGVGLREIWGQVRYPDMIITLQWLYEKHREDNAQILIETMYLLKKRGLDWTSYWTESHYIFKDLDLVKPPIADPSANFAFTHGVNAVQGLKTGAVLYRFTFNQSLIQTSRNAVNWTMTYHGDPAGSVIGDERESGVGPNRGSELCTAVEAMYSLSYLYQMFGDKTYADRCELATFNALPVSITSDHWAHQYLALPNEPFADQLDNPNPFWNVGRNGIIYGLDPNYPCCTVNMPQGLPKYLSASFVRVGENGIGHALLGPAKMSTNTVSGTTVDISCNTIYPFGPVLNYSVTSSEAFTLYLRVPSWANLRSCSVEINGNGAENPLQPDANTGMTQISLPAGTNNVTYRLSASIRVETRGNNSVSVYHGSLLYALDVGQTVTNLPVRIYNQTATYPAVDGPAQIPHRAHDFTFANTKPWNIAIDPSTLEFHASSHNATTSELKNPIFDYEAPPSYITGRGCQINWALDRGVPAALPKLPEGAVWNCTGNVTDVVLRP